MRRGAWGERYNVAGDTGHVVDTWHWISLARIARGDAALSIPTLARLTAVP